MAGAEFQIENGVDPDGFVRVRVLGELDVAVADELTRVLDKLRHDDAKVRLDLSELGFIDSSGLRALITARRHAANDGWAFEVDRNLSEPARRLFELAGVESYMWGAH